MMNTPVIVASLIVVGSVAFAGGYQATNLPPGPQGVTSVMPMRSMQDAGARQHKSPSAETGDRAPHQSGGATTSDDPPNVSSIALASPCDGEDYFAPVPRFFAQGCGPLVWLPMSPADVDGDGVPEIYAAGTTTIASGCPAAPTDGGWIAAQSWLRTGPDGPAPMTNAVGRLDQQTASVLIPMMLNLDPVCGVTSHLGEPYGQQTITAKALGWLDCDRDGDLDLVVQADAKENVFLSDDRWEDPCDGRMCPCGRYDDTQGWWQTWPDHGDTWEYNPCYCPTSPSCGRWVAGGGVWRSRGAPVYFWLENTGFHHARAVPADLNHDGKVNGADLGLLLVAWGPNQ
jgi:hypothetical protein